METDTFILNNYGRKSAFSSFLPGISGFYGIPIWCCYVNRGQCVASFGIQDKDHAIMEFYPAHQAYQNVKRTGFRTFIRKDGVFAEIFADENIDHEMHIGMNGLTIVEKNDALKLTVKVDYFTLPEENVGALVRKVTITNNDSSACHLEVLDGMPAIIPFGVDMDNIKSMGQTVKAWMQVEETQTKVPYYRVRASIVDSISVTEVPGGNFSFGVWEDGSKLDVIVDPDVVFDYDSSLEYPVTFALGGLEGIHKLTQVTSNQLPCSFFEARKQLAAGGSFVIYEMIGQVADHSILTAFLATNKDGTYFECKRAAAECLAEDLVRGISTDTASKEFNAYCKYTYLDNILRGGYPILLGKDKIFYIYSRKHGDLERDYNYFSILPEFFSQGNGNFRDVNQNRRCDVAFSPFVGIENIVKFYSLIQMDGYNPLEIKAVTYHLTEDKANELTDNPELRKFMTGSFTPGAFFLAADRLGMNNQEYRKELFEKVMEAAETQINADFGEGYWSDHWDYNLDLIENYLTVFPEKEKDLLYSKNFTFYVSGISINPRAKRYVKTLNGIRQYYALDKSGLIKNGGKLLRGDFGSGEVITTTLMEKLILLSAVKFSALDAYGMGIEMEGGKPGWYDALNGLPGLLGSSMAETYELGRNLEYTISSLKKYPGDVELLEELADLVSALDRIAKEEKHSLTCEQEVVSFWNRINDVKEAYRKKTCSGISGQRTMIKTSALSAILENWNSIVSIGIEKACGYSTGVCPTYFAYDVTQYREDKDGIHPIHFTPVIVPLFLEGPARFLKLGISRDTKRSLYKSVKNSDLYDRELSMYKVNASLADASFELGRTRAFTPGWLENESIWLHMEYKYLLELLKSGLYEEFAADFQKAAVPFMDPEVYGRSIYENSSFIASSKNPNARIRGKGFVARLSGSTIEFIQMREIMMFGPAPFHMKDNKLALSFVPMIPSYLIKDRDRIYANFLTKTRVTYHLNGLHELIPGRYQTEYMELTDRNGETIRIDGASMDEQSADAVRKGEIEEITVNLNSRASSNSLHF